MPILHALCKEYKLSAFYFWAAKGEKVYFWAMNSCDRALSLIEYQYVTYNSFIMLLTSSSRPFSVSGPIRRAARKLTDIRLDRLG
jgi:hypothetical protein